VLLELVLTIGLKTMKEIVTSPRTLLGRSLLGDEGRYKEIVTRIQSSGVTRKLVRQGGPKEHHGHIQGCAVPSDTPGTSIHVLYYVRGMLLHEQFQASPHLKRTSSSSRFAPWTLLRLFEFRNPEPTNRRPCMVPLKKS
jgi:hypothetical protein